MITPAPARPDAPGDHHTFQRTPGAARACLPPGYQDARIELRARGDLDCDGTRAVWRHDGEVTSGGEVVFGGLRIAPGREIE